jgi:uncharacterized membrane protein YoaK (UPF0700 family)
MEKASRVDQILPYALFGMTSVTGMIDAVSFLGLGHVFTANMTGNIAFLGFAAVGTPGLSAARSSAAVIAFLIGALLGVRIVAGTTSASQLGRAVSAFGIELAFLIAAMVIAIGYGGVPSQQPGKVYALICMTALAMGIGNATVRKLAVQDLTTTVLTLTITGPAADSSLAGGGNPRWQRRIGAAGSMFVGAALGVTEAFSVAWPSLCVVVSFICALVLFFSLRKDLQAQAEIQTR